MKMAHVLACHECDLVHELKAVPIGGGALCALRCRVLYRPKRDSLNRTLALAVVVITMFAAEVFDPRLIWDNVQEAHERAC